MANYIQAIKTKLTGQRNIEIADLEIYLSNPVAIGEHSNIVAAVDSEIEKLTAATDKLSILKINYSEKLTTSEPAPNLYP